MNVDRIYQDDIRNLLGVIKKRLYIILISIIVCIVVSGLISFYVITPVYEAKTSFIINSQFKNDEGNLNYDDLMINEKLAPSFVLMAKTEDVAEKTIQMLNLQITPKTLQDRITATVESDTAIITLSAKGNSSKEAVEITNTLLNVLINEVKKTYPTSDLKILDRATEPKYPTSPNIQLNIVISLLIGIFVSCILIIVLENMDNTIKTEKDVQDYICNSVIGNIPKAKRVPKNLNITKIMNFDDRTFEAYRILRNNIEVLCRSKSIKTLMVTSGGSKEGKTISATILSVLTAEAGKKTLLIDCDLRKSDINKIFNFKGTKGLTNMLISQEKWTDMIIKTGAENLFVLPSGVKVNNPSELLLSIKMKGIIDELKKEFDYIIFDTPPAGIVSDAQIVASFVDGYILLISAGESEIKSTIQAKELLKNVNTNILGILLNKVDMSKNNYFKKLENNKKPKKLWRYSKKSIPL